MGKAICFFIVFFTLGALFSCSMTHRLSGKYNGKGVENLYRDFGEPRSVSETPEGNRVFIYQKETLVKETTIGTGDFTLDPRVSPAFIKTETCRFVVDKEGIIIETHYERKVN